MWPDEWTAHTLGTADLGFCSVHRAGEMLYFIQLDFHQNGDSKD